MNLSDKETLLNRFTTIYRHIAKISNFKIVKMEKELNTMKITTTSIVKLQGIHFMEDNVAPWSFQALNNWSHSLEMPLTDKKLWDDFDIYIPNSWSSKQVIAVLAALDKELPIYD